MQRQYSVLKISKKTRDILKEISEKKELPMSTIIQLLAEKELENIKND